MHNPLLSLSLSYLPFLRLPSSLPQLSVLGQPAAQRRGLHVRHRAGEGTRTHTHTRTHTRTHAHAHARAHTLDTAVTAAALSNRDGSGLGIPALSKRDGSGVGVPRGRVDSPAGRCLGLHFYFLRPLFYFLLPLARRAARGRGLAGWAKEACAWARGLRGRGLLSSLADSSVRSFTSSARSRGVPRAGAGTHAHTRRAVSLCPSFCLSLRYQSQPCARASCRAWAGIAGRLWRCGMCARACAGAPRAPSPE